MAQAVLESGLRHHASQLLQSLIDLVLEHGALIVFAATFAARVGAPVPASPLLVVAGALTVGGPLSLPLAFAVAVLANLLADGLWFEAGRRYGYRVLGVLCRWSMSPDSCVRQSESLIARWGGSSLVAAKFVPGVSVVAAPMAGALGMSVRRFVTYELLGGALWSGLFLGLGVVFSGEVQRLLATLAQAGAAATLLLLALLIGFAGWRWWRRRRFLRAAGIVRVSADALQSAIDRGEAPLILDVRSAAATDLDARHIPGARLVELGEIEALAATLPRDRAIVLYCNCPNEASAAIAAHRLVGAGLARAQPLAGGLEGWAAAGRPVATGHPARLAEPPGPAAARVVA